MEKVNQKTIKYDNYRAVMAVILEKSVASRFVISQQTGLSLMTVGKIVDSLLAQKIIVEDKPLRTTAGRRVGYLSVNKEKVILVVEISDNNSMATLYSLDKTIVSKYSWDNSEKSIEDIFSDIILDLINLNLVEKCVGLSISCDSSKNDEVYEVASRYFPDTLVIVDSPVNLYAYSLIRIMKDFTLFVRLRDDSETGAVIYNGALFRSEDGKFSNYGECIVGGDETLRSRIARMNSVEEYSQLIAYFIYDVCKIIRCESIALDIDTKYCNDDVFKLLDSNLEELSKRFKTHPVSLIDVSSEEYSTHFGALLEVTDKWLDVNLIQKV